MFSFLSKIHKSMRPILFGLGCLTLAACTETSGSGQKINTSAPIPVALLVPYGSAQPTDQVVARGLENAAKLAISDLAGVKIDLRVYSTAGTEAGATNAATKAVNEGAKIIIGPLYASAANAAGVAARARNVNVLTFSNNTEIAGGNVFLLGNTFANTADRLVSYGAKNGKRKITVVHANNAAGNLGADAVRKAAARSGASVVSSVSYDFSQQGIISAMATASQSAKSNSADTVFLTAGVDSDLPFVGQLLPENGLRFPDYQYMGLTRWDLAPQLHAMAGLNNGWFTMPDLNRYNQFSSRYKAVYGGNPHPLAGLAYDGIAAIGALAGTGANDALTTAKLTQGSGFAGVNGTFRFHSNGTNQRALAIATIENKLVKIIDPAPSSFGGAGF